MRARNLKPTFFKNDILGTMPMAARLLFQGLWCMADREGRMEDRPLRIKVEVLPYDEVNVDELLDQLAAQGFIVRYTVGDVRYIQVVNFGKHQNPHIKEAASTIPAPCESGAGTISPPDMYEASPADSPFLNPESPSRTPETNKPDADAPAPRAAGKRAYGFDTEEHRLARQLAARIHENNPKAKKTTEATLQRWSNSVRLMVEQDHRTLEDIETLIAWSQADSFWFANVLSMDGLREKFDKLLAAKIREERQSERPNSTATNGHSRSGDTAYGPLQVESGRVGVRRATGYGN